MKTKETIIKQLENLGVQSYSAVMVHASMRKIGKLEGGADILIDALLEILGPQ